jgi:uncharacterized protein (TIGR03545 family)
MSDAKKSDAKKTKTSKPKGPLRIEAIIPILIIVGLVWAYSVLMLDHHVKKGIEYGASKLYGAQVDVEAVLIKFSDPSITFSGIEITNKENPKQNLLSIGRIRFALLWDALLRAKVVIDESSMTDIAIYSQRKFPGTVYPPPPPEPDKGPSLTEKVSDELKAEAEAQLKNNIFGDVAKILSGADATEQLNQMRDQLLSEKKIKDLQASLTVKKDEWQKRINDLPKPDEVKVIIERVKSTKINTSNPMEAKKQLESLKKDVDKVQEIVGVYQKGQKDIQQDVSGFSTSMKEVDEAARKDMESLQSKFQLPSIDKDSISKALLNKVMGDKIVKLTSLLDKAKAYMPNKKKNSSEDPEFVPHPRGNGRTYKFPVTVGYPLFWLKKAEISSKSTADGFSGDFAGKVLNLTTDSGIINKPTEVRLAGSAPKQEVKNVDFKLLMDYRGDNASTDVDLAVGSHQFPEQSFVSSEDVTFGVGSGPAALKAHAEFEGGELKARIQETIANPVFKTDAKAALLKEALSSVTSRIKSLDMEVSLSGGFTNPKIGLDSNLGTELATGFQKHLKEKIEQARTKLKSFVDDRIKGERAKLTAEYAKVQTAFNGLLQGKDSEFKSLQAELEKAYKEKGSADTNKVQEDLKKKAKDVFKKIKF